MAKRPEKSGRRTRACVLRRFSYVHDTKLFSFVKNPNAHGPEVRLENALDSSDVAVEMEETARTIANSQRSGFRSSNLRDERFAPGAFVIGNSQEFPKRDEVVALSFEIRSFEHVGIRHPLPRNSDERIHFVRDGESHGGERRRIFEFPARGIGMVDIPSARPQWSARVLVPIEKIERERKRRNVGIFTFGAFYGLHEKPTFSRQEIGTESFGEIGRNIAFPMFASDGEFDGGRIDLRGGRIRQISKTENPVFHRMSASKPESARFAISRHGLGVFELAVHGGGIAFRYFERPHVAEFLGFDFLTNDGRFVIRVLQSLSRRIADFFRSSESREFLLGNVALFS